ncbi:anti-sigma factor family protein [Roseateles flavus]|uniref:Anti-sigma factor n=1 Tax=Roseateles flavus TaxID=3149041 RepID=A0ABV0GE41_9BURK
MSAPHDPHGPGNARQDLTPTPPPSLPPPDEASLHALVDGELTSDEAQALRRQLQDWPELAARVQDWQAQREALQALHADELQQPVPARLLDSWRKAAAESGRLTDDTTASGPDAAASGAADAAVSLPWWAHRQAAMWLLMGSVAVSGAAGTGLGWYWGQHEAGAAGPSQAALRPSAPPAFVRDAAIAHAVYQVERRHPVEVAASEQDHLMQWLSKRLGQPLRAPDLQSEGYRLMGGRLLPAGEVVTSHSLARAQLMYENAEGQRLTLYIAVDGSPAGRESGTAFRRSEQRQGELLTRSIYWMDGALAYALSGSVGAEQLDQLSQRVYRELQG